MAESNLEKIRRLERELKRSKRERKRLKRELGESRADSKRQGRRELLCAAIAAIAVLGAPAVQEAVSDPPPPRLSIQQCVESWEKFDNYWVAHPGFDPRVIASIPDQCKTYDVVVGELPPPSAKPGLPAPSSRPALPPPPSRPALPPAPRDGIG